MELLPIVIIVSLLGFFIIITIVLFTWQFLRARERRKKRGSTQSEAQYKPTRKLTLQSGKAIPTSQKLDTASTRDPYSLDLSTPIPKFITPTYTVTCEADPKPSKYRPLILAQDHGHPPILTDLEAQNQNPNNKQSRRVVSEPVRRKEKASPPRIKSVPAKFTVEQKDIWTLPRPALVQIESCRPSTSRSTKSQPPNRSTPKMPKPQPRRSSASRDQEITKSLKRAYQDPKSPDHHTHQLPANSVRVKPQIHSQQSGRTSESRLPAQTMNSSFASSKFIPGPIQKPPPLFSGVSYSPRVKFAPPTHIDHHPASFLSMTDSASPSIDSGEISPTSPFSPPMRVPPPSTIELSHHSTSPSRSDRTSPARIRNTPPHLETPDFGHITFFDSGTSSSDGPKSLKRGVSVMSNRSNFTIASSEISTTNWTFGNAQVVNIYPSMVQEQERYTPPYATKLRSKYGQYPKGRRNKALPVVPRSPLWQKEFWAV
ncbi:hypothetical protein ACLMJK_007396 [Lecanora helva]